MKDTWGCFVEFPAAQECGRVCAIAGQAQRELLRCASRYAALFPASPFDPAFFSTLALAHSFCAPWLSAEELRLTNRITLWAFAVDRAIDELATDRSTVDEIARRCVAVASGAPAPAGDPLAAFLAEIRDELATAPAFGELGAVWRDELGRMLAAMSQEWDWRAARAADPGAPLPTLDEYLDNAETGFSSIFIAHWIWTTGTDPVGDVPALLAASRAVQQFTSLVNDIGSYRRDIRTGDLNALLLTTREEVDDRLAAMAVRCRELLRPLLDSPGRPLATFMDRHIGFNTGFYRVTDYQAESNNPAFGRVGLRPGQGAARPLDPC